MVFPIDVPILTLEIKEIHLNDSMPTPSEEYEVIQIKDLGYTKLWMEFKIK